MKTMEAVAKSDPWVSFRKTFVRDRSPENRKIDSRNVVSSVSNKNTPSSVPMVVLTVGPQEVSPVLKVLTTVESELEKFSLVT